MVRLNSHRGVKLYFDVDCSRRRKAVLMGYADSEEPIESRRLIRVAQARSAMMEVLYDNIGAEFLLVVSNEGCVKGVV